MSNDYGTSAPSNKKKRNGREEDVFDGNSLWDAPEFEPQRSGLETPPVTLGYSGEGWTQGMAQGMATQNPEPALTFSAEFYFQQQERANALNQSGDMKVEGQDSNKMLMEYNNANMQVQVSTNNNQMQFSNSMQPQQSQFPQFNLNALQSQFPQSVQYQFQSYSQQSGSSPYGQFNAQSNFPHTIHTMPFTMTSHPDFVTTHSSASQTSSFNHFTPPANTYLSTNNQLNMFAAQQQSNQQGSVHSPSHQSSTPFVLHSSTPPMSPSLPVQFGLSMEVESAKTLNQFKPSENAQTIATLTQGIQQHKSKIAQLRAMQSQAFQSHGNELTAQLNQLGQNYEAIVGEMQAVIDSLNKLFNYRLLDASELYSLLTLKGDIELELKQMEVLMIECHNKPRTVALSLFITKQPFPKSFRQTQHIDGLTIKIITGTQNKIQTLGNCRAEVVDGANCKSKTGSATCTGNQAEFTDGVAEFSTLAFTVGTRKKPVQLKFVVDVYTTDNITIPIESNVSEKIIIKTNENQYTESEGILLKHEIFTGMSDSATWFRFANSFQNRYVLATKQDRQRPKRPLSPQDLFYIYLSKFSTQSTLPNEKTMISGNAYDAFWNWFGPVLYRLRYQRHLLPLWLSGYICGFVGKLESEKILENASRGAFLIRFSEQRAGELAIAYIPIDEGNDLHNTPSPIQGRVRHYLLQSDDIHAAKKTLPDFLGKCSNLSHIVQVVVDPSKGRVFQQIRKDYVLSDYYSKVGKQDIIPGYEKQL